MVENYVHFRFGLEPRLSLDLVPGLKLEGSTYFEKF